MKRRQVIACAVVAAAIYVGAAAFAFALRHPELTDTQRLLRLWEALLWR